MQATPTRPVSAQRPTTENVISQQQLTAEDTETGRRLALKPGSAAQPRRRRSSRPAGPPAGQCGIFTVCEVVLLLSGYLVRTLCSARSFDRSAEQQRARSTADITLLLRVSYSRPPTA